MLVGSDDRDGSMAAILVEWIVRMMEEVEGESGGESRNGHSVLAAMQSKASQSVATHLIRILALSRRILSIWRLRGPLLRLRRRWSIRIPLPLRRLLILIHFVAMSHKAAVK